MIEVTQKIELLTEAFIQNWLNTQGEEIGIFKSMDGGTEVDCGEGINILAEDVGMLEGTQGTGCNIRQVVLSVGIYTPVKRGEDGLQFSKTSHTLRRLIEDNLYTYLRTLGDGAITDMHLFYAEKVEIGQGVDIEGVKEGYKWFSAGTWALTVNGEENDFEASPV